MTLLKSILELGKHGLALLWAPYIIVSVILLYQHFKAVKSGWYKNTTAGNTSGTGKLKWYQYHKFVGWLIITLIALIVHIFIQISYHGA